jgi:diguanylate cyclase (GGDEF)-like protein
VDLSRVTASVGVATFPDHAADAESLFRHADAAMYAAKRSGKNAVAVAPGPTAAHDR